MIGRMIIALLRLTVAMVQYLTTEQLWHLKFSVKGKIIFIGAEQYG